MTDAAPAPTDGSADQEQHPLVTLLRVHGLQRVAIVDDYYDPPEHLEFSPRDAEDLWGYLEFDDEALAELQGLGHDVRGPGDLVGSVFASFLANRERCPKFAVEWQRSIAGQRREEQRSQLEQIETHIRDVLQLSVATFGSNAAVPEMAIGGVQLLLLDWRLGEDEDAAIKAAVQKASEIHECWPIDQVRPLIVLRIYLRRHESCVSRCVRRDTHGPTEEDSTTIADDLGSVRRVVGHRRTDPG